ncbi:MAG: RNA polymerase, partial [Planctomycetes bacterium]|nr:RNA polymerase [Planctomycetota bacterium]
MYQRDFFDHVNPDGNGPDDRAVAAGFCRMRMIGENIAWNYPDVAAVQDGWEDSPGHRANMVNDGFRYYVGMGYYDSPNGPYYVQLFGDVFPEN